jgi:hypothetical protein
MEGFFNWIASLEPEFAWGLFMLVCLFMVILPYSSQIKKWFWMLFSGEPTEIRDFSFRIIPEYYIGEHGLHEYYVLNSERPIYYKGMSLLLCWDTRGALNTKLYKMVGSEQDKWTVLHKNPKGNVKVIVLEEGLNSYKLEISFPRRKTIEKIISIQAQPIRKLDTFNLSHDDFFGQRDFELNTTRISDTTYRGKRFTLERVQKLRNWNLKRIYSKYKRAYARTPRLFFKSPVTEQKIKINQTINEQRIVQTYRFNPAGYNDAIREQIENNSKQNQNNI